GFDWPDAAGPLEKVQEELAEVAAEMPGSPATDALEEEVGDLLFAVVNLARKLEVEPSGALEAANRKFRDRFAAVEALAEARHLELHSAGLAALDALWNEVKAAPRP